MSTRLQLTLGVVLLAMPGAAPLGCKGGEVEVPEHDGDPFPRDEGSPGRDGTTDTLVVPDRAPSPDLGPPPGDPCTAGQCPGGLICGVDLVCRRRCTLTDCNAKSSECGPGESCGFATSFTGACYPGTIKHLQPCAATGRCEPDTFCLANGGKPQRCLKLCAAGCATGVACVTLQGCKVCDE